MEATKRYIITGPPGTGKTTIIERLKEEGFRCVDEISRQVIVQEQKNNSNGTPWNNLERFTKLVYDLTTKNMTGDKGVTFCDRGLLDCIAYLQEARLPIPPYLKKFNYSQYYQPIVFYAPAWKEIYTTDPQRPGQFEDYLNLDIHLRKTYIDHGFQPITIPQGNVENRLNFILDQLLINKILLH